MEYEKIILDLINRVIKLEKKVSDIENGKFKSMPNKNSMPVKPSLRRDTTKYSFDGKILGKNRLVLEVIRKYVSKNPDVSMDELERVFDKSLQGSLGVVRSLEDVKLTITDWEKRFFTKPEEILTLIDGMSVVCTQWEISNINNFIHRAVQLGFEVKDL